MRELALPPVVDAAWVREHRDSLLLVDVRWFLDGRSGHDAYLAGHLPGAVWADVDTVLSAPPDETDGRHPLPDPADFARALGALGIGDGTAVVAYDADGGPYAARLVWLLRRTGRSAALLDGGLSGWPHGTETGDVTLPEAWLTPVEWPTESLRSADEVAAGDAVVLDARAADRYSGETVLPTDIRSGHIPGARSAPWSANLTADGTFATPAQLRERYEELGVHEGWRSSSTAVAGSPPATTCWRSNTPESPAPPSTRAPGPPGRRTSPGRWRRDRSPDSRRRGSPAGAEPGHRLDQFTLLVREVRQKSVREQVHSRPQPVPARLVAREGDEFAVDPLDHALYGVMLLGEPVEHRAKTRIGIA